MSNRDSIAVADSRVPSTIGTTERPDRTEDVTMEKPVVLVVDDEEDLVELVRYNLEQSEYDVRTACSGLEAVQAVAEDPPDLIVLDLMMPGVDGLQVCNQIRASEKTQHIPILMLTAKGDERDVVQGLEAGADDYVTKPFSVQVLLARISALLRRSERSVPEQDEAIKVDRITLFPRKHEVRIDGKPVQLTAAEFRALHFLARRRGWVFTRQQIVEAVHGPDYVVTDRSVDVLMVGLRKRLGKASSYIETVRGVGYRMKG